MADIRLVLKDAPITEPIQQIGRAKRTNKTALSIVTDHATDYHAPQWREAWYRLGKAPCDRITPDMVLDAINELQAEFKAFKAEHSEEGDSNPSCYSAGDFEAKESELDEMEKEKEQLEKEYEELFNEKTDLEHEKATVEFNLDDLKQDHHELKELCWSAFELEPDTIQSLKTWLKKHDQD